MIDDCMAGNIDMIITKSISRFARNTLDCLKYIRQLKEKNIPVYFEKEYIRIGRNPLFSRLPAFFYAILSLVCRLNLPYVIE
jgi:DNA invertase Pin-like site-specific DNA recombinase